MLFDILDVLPDDLIQKLRDTLVDKLTETAETAGKHQAAATFKKLRSDADFTTAFEQGLTRAAQRFADEYVQQDEDLVAVVLDSPDFFTNVEVQEAMLSMLRQPGSYLESEQTAIARSFATVFRKRINRERVDRAVTYLLRCLAQELWHLPELRGVYSLQFQKLTAEGIREQLIIQKAQLDTLNRLDGGMRDAFLQLADALAAQKLLPAVEVQAEKTLKPAVYHNLPQPEYGKFIGREKELAQVAKVLRPYPHSQHAIVTIDGVGGVGKSTLALEIARRYVHHYDRIPQAERFEAIIWTSGKQTVLTADGIATRHQVLRTLDDIYTAIAITLDRPEITRASETERDEIVVKVLRSQRTLLIVDNLETIDDANVLSFLRECLINKVRVNQSCCQPNDLT